jgi:GDSL-like Lipase/Acylhydrolase
LIKADFPSVVDYEIPAFLADADADLVNTTQPFYEPPRNDTNAVYAIFIGTNDLGNIAFLTDSQVPGKVLSEYTDCVYGAFDSLYAAGGRFFILMNTVPLYLAPQYANDSLHGVTASQYYPDKGPNHTEIAYTMHQETTSVNDIFKYQTPYEVLVANRYPGAHFALFDTWQLFSDIYNHPAAFLNGTHPLSVEGFEHHCNLTGGDCTYKYNNTRPDSFMWYDELHPRCVFERSKCFAVMHLLTLIPVNKLNAFWQ